MTGPHPAAGLKRPNIFSITNVRREVVIECKEFLASVFENADMQVDIRLDALKLARKFEAAKVTPRTVRTQREEGDRREKWRRYEIAQRHWKLSLAIMDTPPKGWADDLYANT